MSGAAPGAVARDRTMSINPAVFDAAALVITASAQQDAFRGVPGHEPDLELARTGELGRSSLPGTPSAAPPASSPGNGPDLADMLRV